MRSSKANTLMLCDLCQHQSNQVIHVNAWQVCQSCVSNNVLRHALDAAEGVKKLHEVVAAAEAEHARALKRQLTAEAKVQSVQSELESATRELAEDTAESELARNAASTIFPPCET